MIVIPNWFRDLLHDSTKILKPRLMPEVTNDICQPLTARSNNALIHAPHAHGQYVSQ